jgi:hypothetical protein
VGDLLSAIVPALQLAGWTASDVTNDGLTVRSAGSAIRIWLDYDPDTTPAVAPPRDRFDVSALRDFRRAVKFYEDGRTE